jgi:ABC-type multidrug transport system ATPase subunit
VRELSEGERQKLALACLFLRSPSLLLLDQPASCLDRGARDAVKAAIERATQRGTAALVADPDWRDITPSKTDRLSLFPKASSLPREVSEEGLFDSPFRRREGQDEAILEFDGLEIKRGGRTVLRDVSGRVSRGEIIALVGDNGSGKTSLLLTIAGLSKPAKGRVRRHYQNGRPLRRTRPALTLQESLWHLSGNAVQGELAWAQKKPASGGGFSQDHIASLLGLETLLERPGLLLSRGEMQRVAIAMALLRNAPIVCLDEPLRFLWDQERKTIGNIFRAAQNRGIAFLIASPVEDMLPWADQVWRLTRGRMETCRNESDYVRSATQSSLEHFGAR